MANNTLQKKIADAIKLIQSAAIDAERKGGVLEVAYSGGKDSDVILELTKMAGVKYKAIYKNTTIDPPYTIKHCIENGVEIVRPKENFRQLIKRKGIPSDRFRFCCEVLKEYKISDVVIVGIRACESKARKERYKEPTSCRITYNKTRREEETTQQYYPILYWDDNDELEFIKERNIKLHPLYYDENGNIVITRRLGCMGCPLMGEKKRRESFKKYPKMLRLYIRCGEEYLKRHPKNPIPKKFGDMYGFMVKKLFYRNKDKYSEKMVGGLFGKLDYKEALEEYFNVEL